MMGAGVGMSGGCWQDVGRALSREGVRRALGGR